MRACTHRGGAQAEGAALPGYKGSMDPFRGMLTLCDACGAARRAADHPLGSAVRGYVTDPAAAVATGR